MKTKTKMDIGTKVSLAEDIIILGFTLLFTAIIVIQIISAIFLFKAGHPGICYALACIAAVNALLIVILYSEVFVVKMDDLL